MGYLEIFNEYLSGRTSSSSAEDQINELLPRLLNEGKSKEYAKASLCMTFFKRCRQYNTGEIKAGDLLLFIRDFVLYVGRFRLPRFVTDVVNREGDALGIITTVNGEVDVIEKIPSALKDNKHYIQEVYRLGDEITEERTKSTGDAYVRRFTKYQSYRSIEQKLAVHSALELPDAHTLMISLPTGGGKSLVTQLLAAYEEKLTIVVVPTVSLVKDQFLQAKECISHEDIKKSIFRYQSNAENDNKEMIRSIEAQSARLIFTSPEAILKSVEFRRALANAAQSGYLHNIIIDEAHIVPDWGVNFRPDFQIFSIVLKEWKELSSNRLRTYLLSATLSDDVVDVLFNLFGDDGKNVEFRCDALRKEPRYIICENHSYERREKQIIEMVKYLPKPIIVYVIEPSVAERYVSLLRKEGIGNAFTYTGDTKDKDRETLLEKWKNNDVDIIVATSAFGMGVDKSNVRTILHACVPENLSRFYQEVGRGGRDGLPSLSVLSYYMGKDDRKNDLSVAFGLVKSSILTKEKIVVRLESILKDTRNWIEGDMVIADLNTVPTDFSEDEAAHAGMRNMCWNANTLLLLHRQGYINIEKAKYDAPNQTYLFTFRIKDVDLLQNPQKLLALLADDRQKEYDMRVDGYHKMADIIRRPRAKCWGKQFVSLFPYAKPICSGCPVHPKGAGIQEDKICVRSISSVEIEPDPPSRLLRRYMGVLPNMLIPVESFDEIDIGKIALAAEKLEVAAFIYPDDVTLDTSIDCMTLTHSEFIEVSSKTPWLLRNGMLILLSKDNGISNKIFEAAYYGNLESYRKVWCGKLNTKIRSQNRTINEFLNCRIRDINSI